MILGALASACASAETRLSEAARTVDNPLIEAFGGPLAISSVEVRYATGVFNDGLDRATTQYVERRMPDDERAAFLAFAAARGDAPDAMAERFSEYLAEADLRGRFTPQEGARGLYLAVAVDEADAKGVLGLALSLTPTFPTTDMSFTLTDGATGAPFAAGHIRRCGSIGDNIAGARDTHGLEFNWTGSDTNFRMMAGMTNALAGCVQALTTTATFPTAPATIGTAVTGDPFFLSVPIRMDEPIYEISVAETGDGS